MYISCISIDRVLTKLQFIDFSQSSEHSLKIELVHVHVQYIKNELIHIHV